MGRVDGKVAIVTGGGSGIGEASAKILAREGAKVMVTDIDDAGGKRVVSEIEAAGGTAAFLHQDVVDEARWVEVVAETVARFGGLNIMVANAGIGIGGPIENYALADWQRQQAINLDGVFLATKHSIPAMRASGSGSIIMISSLAGLQGAPGLAAYCATKGGVRLFAKAVALEMAQSGSRIRVNSVHPGVIDTPIWTKQAGQDSFHEARRPGGNTIDPAIIAQAVVPGGHLGYPEDIAEGILYLASDASRYVTGTELVIDGGVHAG